MKRLEIGDLIDINELAAIAEGVGQLASVGVALLDANHKIIFSHGWQEICTVYHRGNLKSLSNCEDSDKHFIDNLNEKPYTYYKCKNGLWDVAFPVSINQEHLATLYFGQFFFDDEGLDLEYFRNQALKFDYNEDDYLRLVRKVPVISREKMEKMLNLFSGITSTIIKMAEANYRIIQHEIREKEKAHQNLKEKNLLLNQIIDNMPLGIQIFNEHGISEKINHAQRSILGLPNLDEGIGKFNVLTDPYSVKTGASKIYKRVYEGKEIISHEFTYDLNISENKWDTHKKTLTLREIIFPIINDDSEVTKVLSIMQDVTEERQILDQLKENEFNLNLFFTTSIDGFFFMQLPTHILWNNSLNEHEKSEKLEFIFAKMQVTKINNALLEQYSMKEEELIGCTMKDFFSHDENYGREVLLDLLQNGNHRIETHERKADGTPIWIEGNYTCLYDENNRLKGIFGIQRDITAKKENELKLLNSNKELKELNATKDKFFSIIAHDLRGPLGSIVGLGDLLTHALTENELENAGKYAELIKEATQKSFDLMINLLEWAKTQTGKDYFKPVMLNPLKTINKTIEAFDNFALQKNISIQTDYCKTTNERLLVDKNMFETMLRNLISNAIKFSYPNSKIIVSTKSEVDKFTLSVRDFGVGIASHVVEKLLKIEHHITTQGTNQEIGTGLGLTLTKEFVERHNGQIEIESQPGEGSLFTIILPMP